MSKRVANCRGRTTARFGRVRYGRFHVKKIVDPAPPVQPFKIDKPKQKPTILNRVKQFFRRGVQ